MVPALGFEPRSSPHLEASPEYKAGALPLSYAGVLLVEDVGVEPTDLLSQAYGLAIRCITVLPVFL